MRAHGCDVDDTPIKAEVPGKQCITTQTGYMIPLEIRDGLPYLSGRPYTDQEWIDLPHIELTSPQDWDPSVLDHKLTVEEMKEGSKVPTPADIIPHPDYDIEGELVNDGDGSTANFLKLCGLQVNDLNVQAYSVECFG